jgi:hypothetical protein
MPWRQHARPNTLGPGLCMSIYVCVCHGEEIRTISECSRYSAEGPAASDGDSVQRCVWRAVRPSRRMWFRRPGRGRDDGGTQALQRTRAEGGERIKGRNNGGPRLRSSKPGRSGNVNHFSLSIKRMYICTQSRAVSRYRCAASERTSPDGSVHVIVLSKAGICGQARPKLDRRAPPWSIRCYLIIPSDPNQRASRDRS